MMVLDDFMVPVLLNLQVTCAQSPRGLWVGMATHPLTRVDNDPLTAELK
jgi:hypothetical protein